MRLAVRVAIVVVAGCAAALVVSLLYVVPYAIAELYLFGHSIKPAWFDGVPEVFLFLVAGVAAISTGMIVWRWSRDARR